MSLTIKDIISDSSLLKDEHIVHAKKIGGKFLENSEVVLLELTEDEEEMLTSEVANLKCPGFDYFLEAFLIKEMIEEFDNSNQIPDLKQKVDAIIHYVEFDA